MSRHPTVLLAEPNVATRLGIRMALEAAGFDICAEPLDVSSAVTEAVQHRPAVCLIAETLTGGALRAVTTIYQQVETAKLLVLTGSDEHGTLLDVVRAGASGYLRKDLDAGRLGATVHGVLKGEAALSRRLTFELMEALRTRERGRTAPTRPGGASVTDRELEVLELMTEALTTSQMAARLSISEVTVRRHVSSAIGKLGVADRKAAIAVLSGRVDI